MTLRSLLEPSLNFRRGAFACLVAVVALGLAGTVLGFAQAAEADERDPALPERFGLPFPRVGDRGVFVQSTLNHSTDPPTVVDGEHPAGRFEWRGQGVALDGQGQERRVHELVFDSQGWGGDWVEFITYNASWLEHTPFPSMEQVHLYRFDAVSRALVSYEYQSNSTSNMTIPGIVPPLDQEINSASSYVRNRYIEPGGPQPFIPCGIVSDLQGGTMDPLEPTPIWHACDLRPFAVWDDGKPFAGTRPSPALVAIGTGTVGGHEAILFAHTRDANADLKVSPALPYDVLVWMSPDVPYPLRVEVAKDPWNPNHYTVLRLAGFTPGEEPMSREPVPATAGLGLDWKPRQVWGPDDRGLEHAFPLSRAFELARTDPVHEGLRDFLAEYPNAAVQFATYDEIVFEQTVERRWDFVVGDAPGRHEDCIRQTTPRAHATVPPDDVDLGEIPAAATYYFPNDCHTYWASLVHPVAELPAQLPTVASMWNAWVRFAAPADAALGPNAWGFDFTFDPPKVHRLGAGGLQVGLVRTTYVGSPGFWLPPYDDHATIESLARFKSEGPLRDTSFRGYVVDYAEGPAPNPLPDDPQDAPDVVAASYEVRAWVLPSGGYVAGAGILAILAGLAYWLWPTLKGAAVAPLFSRLQGPAALEHPIRAQIVQLVEAEPGIHSEEIMRRLGHGRGAMQHHLRTLVRTGVLTTAAGSRFTCYFPRGRVDRRVMSAAPVLKAAGARRILELVASKPGLDASSVALSTGLSRQAVHQHVRRLGAEGLVASRRERGRLRLDPTPLTGVALAGT